MSTAHIPTANRVCRRQGCSCVVAENDEMVERDGKVFCSEGCATGVGCDHPACQCHDRAGASDSPTK
jgi:hypothetical protein